MNQQVNTKVRSGGFTLIELMLAMTFVSVLLITIALTVIQMANIYNRGMTVKEVNQASRDIADDFRRSVVASEVFIAAPDGSDTADVITVKTGTKAIGGRICTGTVSYLWNYSAPVEAGTDTNLTRPFTASGTLGSPIRFVRVPDASKKYCLLSGSAPTNKNILYDDTVSMVDLIKQGDHALGVLKISISTQDSARDVGTGQQIYSLNYILGTGATSAMDLTNYKCLPPGDPNSDLTYCNVQSFNTVLRVGSAVN